MPGNLRVDEGLRGDAGAALVGKLDVAVVAESLTVIAGIVELDPQRADYENAAAQRTPSADTWESRHEATLDVDIHPLRTRGP